MAEKLSTADKQAAFLDAYKQLGTIKRAAEVVGVDRRTVQRWKNKNRRFAASFRAIKDDQDDLAFANIFDAIEAGDVDASKWLLKQPGRLFHNDPRNDEDLSAAEKLHLQRLEETGRFLERAMADEDKRAELYAQQEAHEA